MPVNLDFIRQRVHRAVVAVLKEEQQHTEAILSVPVGYGVGGYVTVRSRPGEPPRLETGELQGNVDSSAELHPDRVEGRIRVERPSTPDVPFILQEQMSRPILTQSETRLRTNGGDRIAHHVLGKAK
jgi:hypothetical protein